MRTEEKKDREKLKEATLDPYLRVSLHQACAVRGSLLPKWCPQATLFAACPATAAGQALGSSSRDEGNFCRMQIYFYSRTCLETLAAL